MKNLFLIALLFVQSSLLQVHAQQQSQDDTDLLTVVGSIGVTQGGVQDIKHFRDSIASGNIPHPNTLTAEGLLSEHNIILSGTGKCEQLFCLTGEAVEASLIVPETAQYFVGLGFDTNLDGDSWKRAPVNLVAVVDRSGSMSGTPLKLVKESLLEMLPHLGPEDQLSIVLYGSGTQLLLQPTRTTSRNKHTIASQVENIESSGGTNMEAGLELGYQTARSAKRDFEGITRLVLFTDERPNIGDTSATGFMGMAKEGSNNDIGLTTIGVGVQFGAQLATEISSVRGGNLFFIRRSEDIDNLVEDEFDFMVSEIAHDLEIRITPKEGFKISGVYGIPNDLLGWQNEKTVTIKIPTVFLSSYNGGIFLTLQQDHEDSFLPKVVVGSSDMLVDARLSYLPLETDQRATSDLTVFGPHDKPSDGIQLAQNLIDEFTSIHSAATAHHITNDQEAAFQALHHLAGKVRSDEHGWANEEKGMIYTMEAKLAYLSGHSAELQTNIPFAKLWGVWEVTRIEGETDVEKWDRFSFSDDNRFALYDRDDSEYYIDERENYEATNRQIYFEESELMFDYRVNRRRLTLDHKKTGVKIILKRSEMPDLS